MKIQIGVALSTGSKALGVMLILIPAAEVPQESWTHKSSAFVAAVLPLKTRPNPPQHCHPRGSPGTAVPYLHSSWGGEIGPRGSAGTRIGSKERSACFQLVCDSASPARQPLCAFPLHQICSSVDTVCHVLKFCSVWSTLGTLSGKCWHFACFSSLPGPNCQVPVMCGIFQTTELTDNLFNKCSLKK